MKEQKLNIVGAIALICIFIAAALTHNQLKWLVGVFLILFILIFANLLVELTTWVEAFFLSTIFMITGFTLLFWL